MKTIEILNLKIGYPNHRKQKTQIGPEINVDSSEGELIALIGPNGIGKSTLLRTITRLQPSMSGKILINGKQQTEIDRNEYSRLLSFVSTEPVRVQNFSVYQLIALGRFPYTNWLGNITYSDKEIIEESLKLVNLDIFKVKPVNELSDGERQRVMIARALAQDTPIIVLDEPTAYLDLINKHDIVHLLRKLALTKNKTIIFSTHDLNIALSEADKIWLMLPDEVKQGAPEDLILENSFSEIFGTSLEFNWHSGTFSQIRSSAKTISLKGNPGIVYDLTSKALERIGFSKNENAEQSVEVKTGINENSFIVKGFSEEKESKSIYELCRFLRSY